MNGEGTVTAPDGSGRQVKLITADDVGAVVLEGVRNNDLYIITHPGSEPQVVARHRAIEHAYQVQRERHPELP